jgi:hypothetical protein
MLCEGLVLNMFKNIDEDGELTEMDKQQLKRFYLENLIAPETRKLLEKCFPNGFNKPGLIIG